MDWELGISALPNFFPFIQFIGVQNGQHTSGSGGKFKILISKALYCINTERSWPIYGVDTSQPRRKQKIAAGLLIGARAPFSAHLAFMLCHF